ncbi:leucine-rich repeat domain-containing protein [uncultured Algibacter sp.]|uniref:leucine-rich repeat domain-containing protein n=1 Tax=uncultured Algibacter sp. TaxID=298659 RepID=UPI0026178D0A|nr:leucine-rich repeat domain-containing protein [uncultured Algibacter sp.]
MQLTEEQIKKGYWYFNRTDNFPPNGKLLEEYNGEEKLNLICSKGNESYTQTKKRENSYITDIPKTLDNVKVLWVYSIKQETFDVISGLKNLESLCVHSNRITDLSALSNLKKLKHLGLLSLTKIDDIKPICKLRGLQTLMIENFKKVTDFSQLSELTELRGLQIDGDMYTAQIIENFDFLNSLADLKYLTFTNSRGKTKNFDAISKLSNLEMIQSSTNYPKKEFQKLRGMKSLKYIGGNIEPLINNER